VAFEAGKKRKAAGEVGRERSLGPASCIRDLGVFIQKAVGNLGEAAVQTGSTAF
jgi:hypothetical protein